MQRIKRIAAVVLFSTALAAQTQVDLATQSKRVDFTSAPSTKPMKSGTALPSTCSVGELFFKTDASQGANVYGCVSSNLWAPQGPPAPQGQNGAVLSVVGTAAAWIPLGGDVDGPPGATTVGKLQNRAVSNTAPQVGQALIWTGTTWQPQTVSSGAGSITVENNSTVVGTR